MRCPRSTENSKNCSAVRPKDRQRKDKLLRILLKDWTVVSHLEFVGNATGHYLEGPKKHFSTGMLSTRSTGPP